MSRPRLRALIAILAALVVGGTVAATLPARAHPQNGHGHSAHTGTGYLALGDSVPFGFRESANLPTPDYSKPTTFVGFPEDVAADERLRVTNAACPGETTTSFITGTPPSNGCEGGYRDVFPLHVSYTGSQLDFAVRFLRQHPDTRLVSLMIGANDGFRCQNTTADHCVNELPAVLKQVGANVATILGRIRHDAHYRGEIVLVNYYSLDYSDATQTGLSSKLNETLDTAAAPYHVQVADGFGALRTAAAQAGGDSCKTGLLTTLTTGGCGVHPSVAGQQLLAGAVERVLQRDR